MKEKLGAIRSTEQRNVILEELKKMDTHPTADELYIKIKEVLPKISIATVYRNLEDLSKSGYALKLSTFGSQKRFDGHTSPHFHIYCKKCGAVGDIYEPFEISKEYKNLKTNFKISNYNLDFYGLCPKCQKSNEN